VTVVVLISDFGLVDTYVAEMKAALLRLGPGDLVLVDGTHDLPAGDVAAGRWVLSHLWSQFPVGAVFLTVVDPGVGTERPAIAAGADGRWFVGPGNGLAAHLRGADALVVRRLTRPQPPPGLHPATTFAGRDLFAPAAAHLVGGGDPADLGPAGLALDLGPAANPDGPPRVVWIDRFGNLVTDLARDGELGAILAAGANVLVNGEPVAGPRQHYAGAPAGTPFWYWGSRDTLEVAVDGASAADRLDAKPGLVISVQTS
jgi:S-adenosylmethionine hydrolase